MNRIRKEIASYQKEAAQQEAKIADLEAKGDTDTIDKQKEVLAETIAMVPECEARLKDAQADVEAILGGASDELKSKEMYTEAMTMIKELGGTVVEEEEEEL
jgi:tubulin-specific chaperone A